MSHFLAECSGRPITRAGNSNNNGAVCIPYFWYNNYTDNIVIEKMRTYKGNWPTSVQCINSKCQLTSKAICSSTSDVCTCYDTCPLGYAFFINKKSRFLVPCSGRGACKSNGTCVCPSGYLQPNCEIHCSETELGCCMSDSDCNGSTCKNQDIEGIGYCQ